MSHSKEHHRDKKHKHTQKEEHQKLLEHRHRVPGYIRRQEQQAAAAMEKLRAQNTKGTLKGVNGNDDNIS